MQGPIVAAAQRGGVYSSMALVTEKLSRSQAAAAGVDGVTAVVLAGVPGTHAYVAVGLLPSVPLPEWGPGAPLAEKDGSGALPCLMHRLKRVVFMLRLKESSLCPLLCTRT